MSHTHGRVVTQLYQLHGHAGEELGVVRVRGGSSIELEQEANHVGRCGKVACLVEGRAVVNIVVRIFVGVGLI